MQKEVSICLVSKAGTISLKIFERKSIVRFENGVESIVWAFKCTVFQQDHTPLNIAVIVEQ